MSVLRSSSDGPEPLDLDAARERFLVQLKADGRSEHTIGQYQRHLLLLAGWAAREGLSADVAALDPGPWRASSPRRRRSRRRTGGPSGRAR